MTVKTAMEDNVNQAQAKAEILNVWRALPPEERSNEAQAAQFAMAQYLNYLFRCVGDRFQVIKGWVTNDLNSYPKD
jgi:hypothetical protein